MEFTDEKSVKKYFEENECAVTHIENEHLMSITYRNKNYTLLFSGEDFQIQLEDIVNIIKQIKCEV